MIRDLGCASPSRSHTISPSSYRCRSTSPSSPYKRGTHTPTTAYTPSPPTPPPVDRVDPGVVVHHGPLPPPAGMVHSSQQRPLPNPHAVPQSPQNFFPVAMLYPAMMMETAHDPLRLCSVGGHGPPGSLLNNRHWRAGTDTFNAPSPLPSYTLEQCTGLHQGPTLYALRTFILHRRFPHHRDLTTGESHLQKAQRYLFAERPPERSNQLIIGIDSEQLSNLAVAAIMTNDNSTLLTRFCREICRILWEVECDDKVSLSFTNLRTGYHGALSMLRLMRDMIYGAVVVSDVLAARLAQTVVNQHLGYFKDWNEGVRSGDRGLRMEILWRLTSVEDDIGLLTEMALLWPDAASAPPDTEKYKLADVIHHELWVILAYQQDDGNWPTVVGKSNIGMRTAALLERGRWHAIACLQHMHAYFAAAIQSRRYMLPLIAKALLRLESHDS